MKFSTTVILLSALHVVLGANLSSTDQAAKKKRGLSCARFCVCLEAYANGDDEHEGMIDGLVDVIELSAHATAAAADGKITPEEAEELARNVGSVVGAMGSAAEAAADANDKFDQKQAAKTQQSQVQQPALPESQPQLKSLVKAEAQSNTNQDILFNPEMQIDFEPASVKAAGSVKPKKSSKKTKVAADGEAVAKPTKSKRSKSSKEENLAQ